MYIQNEHIFAPYYLRAMYSRGEGEALKIN